MRVRTKFIISSLLVLGLNASLVVGATVLLRRGERSIATSLERNRQSLNRVLELEIALRDQVVTLKDFLLFERNPGDMARYHQARDHFLIGLAELEQLVPETEAISSIRRRHQNLVQLAAQLSDTPSTLNELQLDVRAINSFRQDISLYLDLLLDELQQQDNQVQQEVRQFQKSIFLVQISTVGILLLIFLIQFWLILFPVFQSLQSLRLGVAKVGGGFRFSPQYPNR